MLASEFAAETDPGAVERQDVLVKMLSDFTTESVIGVALGFVDPRVMDSEEAVPSLLLEWARPVVGYCLYQGGFEPLDDAGGYIEKEFYHKLGGTFINQVLSYVQPVQLIAMPRPLPQTARGDAAHCGGSLGPGTVGVPATRKAVRGFLTAGHVSPVIDHSNPPVAYGSGGTLVGTVVERMCYQFDRYGSPVQKEADIPDVAFIELDNQNDPIAATNYVAGPAKKWDIVTSYGAVTSGQSAPLAAVRCAITSGNEAYGNWAEAMFTRKAISTFGDSGAAVFNADAQVVGQVVGGYPGAFSVIQDIEYLLVATEAVL